MRFFILGNLAAWFGLNLLLCSQLNANELLSAGPMVGYSEMREVPVWVQTTQAADVQLRFWPKNNPNQKATTGIQKTNYDQAHTATLYARSLLPGTRYEYEVLLNGEAADLPYVTEFQTIPFYQEKAPPPDFTLAVGGGNYVLDAPFDPLNRKPGAEHSIFLAIQSKQPDMMLWTGNNVYLRESDWNSLSGYYARYTHNRALPELQPLLASVHHIATWSQADYGSLGADSYKWNRDTAHKAFQHFWANPSYGVSDVEGITTTARWSDVDFFLLDDRSHRDLTHTIPQKRVVFGPKQIKWLLESLKKSTATFKVIVSGSPILNPESNQENFIIAPKERDSFFEELKNERISGVLFISGGKRHGELTKLIRAGAPPLYELTMGPLTGRPDSKTLELNYFRVPNTSTFKRHFALVNFFGEEEDRKITFSGFDSLGEKLWSETLSAKQMQFK